MNISVLIEGERGAKKIYNRWIEYANNNLTKINYMSEFEDNNYLVTFGKGHNQTLARIPIAVSDVNSVDAIDRLVIGIDTEENTFNEKRDEVQQEIIKAGIKKEYFIVIHDFCFETWLLGNTKVFPNFPRGKELREFYKIFKIKKDDPENLPAVREHGWNRAQFAYRYLKAGMADRRYGGARITYNKKNPGTVVERYYYEEVNKRHSKVGHIKSFQSFIRAFN